MDFVLKNDREREIINSGTISRLANVVYPCVVNPCVEICERCEQPRSLMRI